MGRHRVLIVDDEEYIREVLGEYLEAHEFDVIGVGTGREAIDLILVRKEIFDAALVDWSIPGIDGRDVVQQIHEAQPDCILFAITGHEVDAVRKTGAGNLLAAVYRKPFSLKALASDLDGRIRGAGN